MLNKISVWVVLLLMVPGLSGAEQAKDIKTIDDVLALVKEAVEYYRGKASTAQLDMIIHRPEWERTMTIKVWTKGQKDSLFFIIAPPKDQGNGTLKIGREMWTYNPKVNRVIKLPPSMMSQAWMGSDFSNNDIAKSDSVLEDYDHALESIDTSGSQKVYVVQSMPKPTAPVVWGMQKLFVREDKILLRQEFYDEDMQLVKTMVGSDIRMFGDKLFPAIWRMQKADIENEYTELNYAELTFVDVLPDKLFNISSLKNMGR